MPKHRVLLAPLLILTFGFFAGCATNRQLAVDPPKSETSPLPIPKNQALVTGDDYYLKLVSDFEVKGDSALKGGCSEVGGSYETGDLSAALVFHVRNDALKLTREGSGFLYQATTGKCNFKLETKKAVLTPWLRLDSAKETQTEYSFLTSNSHEANLSQLVGDINAASNLLMLTGVGTGVAVMGKLATNFVDTSAPQVTKPMPSAKYSTETHTLPASVSLGSDGAKLIHSRLPVFEITEGGNKFWASENRLLGELHIYPEIASSLLMKSFQAGLPDAHDLSLEELWRVPIQSSSGEIPLQQLINQIPGGDKPNLQPDWQNYDDVETQCRRLKLVMKDLGFNKFDRDAVLFYFLGKSPDWKNFNITAQKAMADAVRPRLLEQYRERNFSGCLASDDYTAMKSMNLPVNSDQDWDNLTSNRQKKESVISSLQSVGRQLLAALGNADKDEMARQLYPLLASDKGAGTVLLKNHLGNFGLESLLQIPPIADEGVTISAAQLSSVFASLNVERYSCVRPAQDQGQPLANMGILLFTSKPGSPREKGGAVEFELSQGKISRLSFQHPSFRDFEQNIADYPDLGGCRIDSDLLNRLH